MISHTLRFAGALRIRICFNSFYSRLGNPPAWHRGLPGPSGPKPQKSPKRVQGVPAPPAPGSPRVPKECAPESEKSPKTQLRALLGDSFRTRGALFGDSGAPRGRRPRDTLSDSFRTLLGFRARRAREPSVPGGGVHNRLGTLLNPRIYKSLLPGCKYPDSISI